jgi:antitoxin ParD1/3/4
MARAVKQRDKSGKYASESEVIREGLRALEAHEEAIEYWLQTGGVARYEAWRAHPGRTISVAEDRAALKQHIRNRRRTSAT